MRTPHLRKRLGGFVGRLRLGTSAISQKSLVGLGNKSPSLAGTVPQFGTKLVSYEVGRTDVGARRSVGRSGCSCGLVACCQVGTGEGGRDRWTGKQPSAPARGSRAVLTCYWCRGPSRAVLKQRSSGRHDEAEEAREEASGLYGWRGCACLEWWLVWMSSLTMAEGRLHQRKADDLASTPTPRAAADPGRAARSPEALSHKAPWH